MSAILPFEAEHPQVSIDELLHLRAPSVYLVKVDGESMQGGLASTPVTCWWWIAW